MKKSISTLLLLIAFQSSQAATLANRWSFDTDTTDSVGGNTGILVGGATVDPGRLSLTGLGTSTAANHMAFTTPVEVGVNYGATGITIESWYTDTGTGTWGKLFQFGTNAAGQEIGYTHTRANGEMSGVDRDGAKLLEEQVAQNEEHHLVISISSDGNLNAWVDGDKKISDTDTNDLANVTSDFEGIGATSWGDQGMAGSVNEFRIWSGTLSDVEVTQNFTNGPDTLPNVDDTDLDGIPDNWELAQTGITDLTQLDGILTGPGPGAGTGDFDGDGLFDLEEFQRTTDPIVDDTDTDGLLDGPEVKSHLTNPLVIDTDGDTLSDGVEVNDHGTNPTLKDSDMDFIDDNVELDNGTSPIDADDPGLFTGAVIVHRWSFDTDATDSVGGNTGILVGGATVDPGRLSLTGLGTGTAANHMAFTNPVEVGVNYGATGITIESWYTDTGTGTWGKLFQFGTNAAGQEIGYTHTRANGEMSGVDRDGAKLFEEQVTQNEEHHLVITVSSDGNLNAWVDGDKKISDTDTNDLANVTSDFEGIGATSWGDPGMAGSVNEFRIWKGTLSSSDVADNFAIGPDSLAGGEGLSISSITRDNDTGAVTLMFKSIAGHTYRIDSAPTLAPADSPLWLDVDDSFRATGDVSTFTDTAASGAKLFYRIQDITN
jgi:hypothetical protein